MWFAPVSKNLTEQRRGEWMKKNFLPSSGLLSEAWVNKVIEKGYELQSMTHSGLIGKVGMYGQTLMPKGFAR